VFVAVGIQLAICILHIIICGLSSSTVFFHMSHEWHDYRGRSYGILNVCFDFLYNFCLKHFLILRRILLAVIIKVYWYLLFLSYFNET
jgi:hypothetical protein